MGKKRKEREAQSDDDDSSKSRTKRTDSDKLVVKPQLLPSMIKNKDKRSAVYAKIKHEKKVEKRKNAKAREALESRALELGEEVYLIPNLAVLHFLPYLLEFDNDEIVIIIIINVSASTKEDSPNN